MRRSLANGSTRLKPSDRKYSIATGRPPFSPKGEPECSLKRELSYAHSFKYVSRATLSPGTGCREATGEGSLGLQIPHPAPLLLMPHLLPEGEGRAVPRAG